jgi:hypothetical protein
VSVIRFIKEAGGRLLFGQGRADLPKPLPKAAAGGTRGSAKVAQVDRQSVIKDKYYGDSDDGVLSKQEAWLNSP